MTENCSDREDGLVHCITRVQMGQQVAHARAVPPGTEVKKLASACRSNKTCLTNVLCAGGRLVTSDCKLAIP